MTRILKYRELLLVAVIIVLTAAFSYRAPGFAAPGNLAKIFNDTSILIILALGQMAVILTRSIDLSVAANLSFTGMAIAMLNAAYPGIPLPLLIVVALGIGATLGAINGFMVWKIGIPPIVATLGTLTIYRGMAFVLSGGAWVNQTQMTPDFLNTPRVPVLGLPLLGWTAILVIAIIAVVFTRTVFGRALYAAGGNPTAALYAGIDVGRTRFFAFVLSGALAGLCGYLWVSRRLCGHRRRFRTRHRRRLRHRRDLDPWWHRLRRWGGPGRSVPRRHQECIAGDQHLPLLADGHFGPRDHHRRAFQCPAGATQGSLHPA
jgi:rhamnose transport system permease protein